MKPLSYLTSFKPVDLDLSFIEIVKPSDCSMLHYHTNGVCSGYAHTHKRGNIPHGHHGSRYIGVAKR